MQLQMSDGMFAPSTRNGYGGLLELPSTVVAGLASPVMVVLAAVLPVLPDPRAATPSEIIGHSIRFRLFRP